MAFILFVKYQILLSLSRLFHKWSNFLLRIEAMRNFSADAKLILFHSWRFDDGISCLKL
mgnify:CR=1 FL=1|jgi:hypothetical protein